MIDPKVIRLTEKLEALIVGAENDLLGGLTAVERKVFRSVKDQLNLLNKEGGKFVFDEANTALVNELDQIIIDSIQDSSYPSDVNKYLQNFDTVTDFQADIHSELNQISPEELRNLVDPFKRQIVDDTLSGLTGSGVATEFAEPVRQELFKNIVAGANSSDVEKVLRQMIEGDASKLGGLERYVGQVTRDSLNQYEGQVNAKIADEYDLDAFEYVGSLIDDSRSQCVHWVNKRVITKEELPNLISNAFTSGQGMIPGTNAENFAVFRGGYNCRHSAIPFRLTEREHERLKQEKEEEDEKPVTIEETRDGITRAEKDLNLTYGKSKLVPSNLRDEGIPDQVFILSDNGKNRITTANSFYRKGDGIVRTALKSNRYKNNPYARKNVIVHEFGHRTHDERGFFTYEFEKGRIKNISKPNHKAAFEKSKKLINDRIKNDKNFRRDMTSFSSTRKRLNEELKDQFTEREISEMLLSYMDTIEAATGGSYGAGHGARYFRQGSGMMQPFEWYAHASENYFVGNPVFQKEFPELYEQMNDYFYNEVVKKTDELKPFLK